MRPLLHQERFSLWIRSQRLAKLSNVASFTWNNQENTSSVSQNVNFNQIKSYFIPAVCYPLVRSSLYLVPFLNEQIQEEKISICSMPFKQYLNLMCVWACVWVCACLWVWVCTLCVTVRSRAVCVYVCLTKAMINQSINPSNQLFNTVTNQHTPQNMLIHSFNWLCSLAKWLLQLRIHKWITRACSFCQFKNCTSSTHSYHGWQSGSIGRASDSRSKGRRFDSRQEHKKKYYFSVKNVVLTRCWCAQPLCVYAHTTMITYAH